MPGPLFFAAAEPAAHGVDDALLDRFGNECAAVKEHQVGHGVGFAQDVADLFAVVLQEAHQVAGDGWFRFVGQAEFADGGALGRVAFIVAVDDGEKTLPE